MSKLGRWAQKNSDPYYLPDANSVRTSLDRKDRRALPTTYEKNKKTKKLIDRLTNMCVLGSIQDMNE